MDTFDKEEGNGSPEQSTEVGRPGRHRLSQNQREMVEFC